MSHFVVQKGIRLGVNLTSPTPTPHYTQSHRTFSGEKLRAKRFPTSTRVVLRLPLVAGERPVGVTALHHVCMYSP